jgi:alanyl-tRNA synthetase
MTDRIYWQDAYQREFSARVLERKAVGDHSAVMLDRTAFYPEGGGQPCDLGFLDGVAVVDVRSGEEGVLHFTTAEIAGTVVRGQIDWERRFDHMQQHTGQHILSQACMRTVGANTVGFHLGETVCTIDLDQDDLAGTQLAGSEDLANRVISENRAVNASIASSHEALDGLDLRGVPHIDSPVRIVHVEGFDATACGGTHLRTTSEVGMVKIVASQRHRGGTTRVSFLCGRRAWADYDRKHKLVSGLAAHLTTREVEVLSAVQRLSDEVRQARRAQRKAQNELLEAEAGRLYAEAASVGGARVAKASYDSGDLDALSVKHLATLLGQRPGCIALLGWRGEKSQLTFARADDVDVDVGALMRLACERLEGRGGGRPDWAQGGGAGSAPIEPALDLALKTLRERAADS